MYGCSKNIKNIFQNVLGNVLKLINIHYDECNAPAHVRSIIRSLILRNMSKYKTKICLDVYLQCNTMILCRVHWPHGSVPAPLRPLCHPPQGIQIVSWKQIQLLSASIHLADWRLTARSREAARFGFRLYQSFWNLTGTSAAEWHDYHNIQSRGFETSRDLAVTLLTA